MPSQPAAPVAATALLHCSPARTVWYRSAANGEPEVVVKVYLRDSLADAEREFAMGRLARGPGVVDYLHVAEGEDRRPCVTTRYVAGDNLAAVVARCGALPAAEACARVAAVARTLARLHALLAPELPNGMCHGDLKPQNLLATATDTLLLDFEHAVAIGAAAGNPQSDGASAFTAPEVRSGAAPHGARDVFALGATLAYLLDGGGPHTVPRAPALDKVLARCLAADPRQRPTATALAAHLDELAATLRDDPAEAVLHDWASGTFARDTAPTPATGDARAHGWSRRRRLVQRVPRLLERPHGVPTDPAGLAAELHRTAAVLRRFPRHPGALLRRNELLRATGDLLAHAAAHTHALTKAEQFPLAAQWLTDLEQLVIGATALPGGLAAVTSVADGAPPGPLQRAPVEFLWRLAQRVAQAAAELAARAERVTQAECALDLARAEREVDELAAEYGGTSPTTAQRRDRLHRLAFYLDRVGRAADNVDRLGRMWDEATLRPLVDLVARAAAASAHRSRGGGAVGLRSLQLTLTNLAEEFPHVTVVAPALDALSQALAHLTDQAWKQLADAEQRLRIVPVPVRPLQLALGRLDTFRALEAFVDRDERPRSQLLDGLERLRLGFEHARAARDRLAENAEHALARGHWTTGLFDMERAVAGMNPRDDQERAEAERLQEKLTAARRTKQEIEAAVRRNVELTAEYAALEDDPSSTFAARILALEQRRDCLTFLVMRTPNERAALYRQDLRSVDAQIASERASNAERRLDTTTDPGERLRVVRETLEQLSANASTDDHGAEPPGRLVRLIEHWQTLAEQCELALATVRAERAQRVRHRRRTLVFAVVAMLVTSTAVAFAVRSWWFDPPPANAAGK